MSDVFVRNKRLYAQEQSAFGTILNSAGAATVANADACLITDGISVQSNQDLVVRPDLTGSLDAVSEQPGRRLATFLVPMSMAGNGAAGSEPDCKKLLKSGFGVAPTINAGVSVVYALGDGLYYLSIWNFNSSLANATQKVAFDSLVQRIVMEWGGNVPSIAFSGEAKWVYDNDQAADGTTLAAAKGGLTAWPTEPSAPVVNGTHPLGFKGSAVIDSVTYTSVMRVRLELAVARELRKIGNDEFAGAGAIGERVVSGEMTLVDDDSAGMRALKQKQIANTAIAMTFTVGTVAGNRWVHALTGVKLRTPTYGTEGVRQTITFPWRAYPSTILLKDQYTLTIN